MTRSNSVAVAGSEAAQDAVGFGHQEGELLLEAGRRGLLTSCLRDAEKLLRHAGDAKQPLSLLPRKRLWWV